MGKAIRLLLFAVLALMPCLLSLAYASDDTQLPTAAYVNQMIENDTAPPPPDFLEFESCVPEDVQEDAERQFRPPEPVCFEPCMPDGD
jgi:hypothetical protein